MHSIKLYNKIAKCGLDELPGQHFTVGEGEAAPEGVLVRSFAMDATTLTPGLLCIGRAGAGVNNIPVDECSKRGIVVFNTPGANANAVKELVVAGLLLGSRKIHAGINWVSSLAGQNGVAALVEKGKADYTGPEIMGKTLGVVGLGAIGGLVANAAVALGMNVLGFDPFLTDELKVKLSEKVQVCGSEEDVWAKADYISVHVPLLPQTKHKYNDNFFGKCKHGLRVLNFARGELFDDKAVFAALESGKLGCYITDFPTEAHLGNEKVIAIPHLGASTPESEENCATMAAAQVREYLQNGNIKNSVNYPDVSCQMGQGERLCVLHQNLEGYLSKLQELVNRSGVADGTKSGTKPEFGYVIVDAKPGADTTSLETQVKQQAGTVLVRRIKNG
jgi:D-3-phosphoglycerate dehydrogenase